MWVRQIEVDWGCLPTLHGTPPRTTAEGGCKDPRQLWVSTELNWTMYLAHRCFTESISLWVMDYLSMICGLLHNYCKILFKYPNPRKKRCVVKSIIQNHEAANVNVKALVCNLYTMQLAAKLLQTTVSRSTDWQMTLTLWCAQSSLDHQIMSGSKQGCASVSTPRSRGSLETH